MHELALFAGAGGGILGGKLLGWRTVCAVECDAFAASVLAQRQNDGVLEPFPIWSDVCAFDGRPWRGIVDVVSGGFPCKDISAAGKGAGISGERSGLWREMARIIGEVRPRFALVENSPVLTSRGLGHVLGDLAALGYDARWGVLGAIHAGAPHKRERIWIVAHSPGEQHESGSSAQRGARTEVLPMADPISDGWEQRRSQPEGGLRLSPSEFSGSTLADSSRLQSRREEQRAERERTRTRCERSRERERERERRTWPTPTACMSKGTSQNALTRKDGTSRANARLDHAVLFRTPNATDGAKWSHQTQAEREAKGQQVRLTHQLEAGGSLNPEWVEWLMGWPLGWTDCAASATDKFQQWSAAHGKSSQPTSSTPESLSSTLNPAEFPT